MFARTYRTLVLVCCTAGLTLSRDTRAWAQPPCEVLGRLSLATGGAQANGDNEFTDYDDRTISADGRFVVFGTQATNFGTPDTNGLPDLARHDRDTGETTIVSVASDGTIGNDASLQPSISADGRFIAFTSYATNLVPDDTNGVRDVFVRDGLLGTTERVSTASDGGQGDGISATPSISTDGRIVVFVSAATNLVPGDTNAATDIFVKDRDTGETTVVSVRSDQTVGNANSFRQQVSADGRKVVFVSFATNLVPNDTNGVLDVFVHDRLTGETTRVSVASDGTEANAVWPPAAPGETSRDPGISADGNFVVFESWATNLVPGDTNNNADVYLHNLAAHTTHRISLGHLGQEGLFGSFDPSLSADGRFVAFVSAEPGFLPIPDTNVVGDVFIRDTLTGALVRTSSNAAGIQPEESVQDPSISADGRFVVFSTPATSLDPTDTNGFSDVYFTGNCLAPAGPGFTWAMDPPDTAAGGEPISALWSLSQFTGPITDNQLHFGVSSVLGSSDVKPGVAGVHGHTFTAPNVGWSDSPTAFAYLVRALDNGTQVLSAPRMVEVTSGPMPPTVEWTQPPPVSAPSGGQFPVEWTVSGFVDPAGENQVAYGVTTAAGMTPNQPGGDGIYSALVDVPAVSTSGTLFFAAFARNDIEFAFAQVVPVAIQVPACSLALTAPNGGETIAAGSTVNITWTGAPESGAPDVGLVLHRPGAPPETIVASTPNTGSFNWTVPPGLPPSAAYAIRVVEVANPTACFDESDASFTITGPCTLAIVAPAGGATWACDTPQSVTWTGAPTLGEDVSVTLSKGGVPLELAAATPSAAGAFDFILPGGLPPGNDYTISVTDPTEPLCSPTSAPFTVTCGLPSACSLVLTAPNGGESWNIGTTETVTWGGSPGGGALDVSLVLARAGAADITIADRIQNSGTYDWTVPGNLTPADYTVRVVDPDNPGTCVDASDATFGISHPGLACSLAVKGITGGAILTGGTQPMITWEGTTESGSPDVRITLLFNDIPLQVIATKTANVGAFSGWLVPSPKIQFAGTYAIEVADAQNPGGCRAVSVPLTIQ